MVQPKKESFRFVENKRVWEEGMERSKGRRRQGRKEGRFPHTYLLVAEPETGMASLHQGLHGS